MKKYLVIQIFNILFKIRTDRRIKKECSKNAPYPIYMQICTSHGSIADGSPHIMSNSLQLLENPVPKPHLTAHVLASLHLTIPLTIHP